MSLLVLVIDGEEATRRSTIIVLKNNDIGVLEAPSIERAKELFAGFQDKLDAVVFTGSRIDNLKASNPFDRIDPDAPALVTFIKERFSKPIINGAYMYEEQMMKAGCTRSYDKHRPTELVAILRGMKEGN